MFTITHKERRNQGDIAQQLRTPQAINTLPAGEPASRGSLGPEAQAGGHIEARVFEQAIDVRVDWNGSAASMGRFEVLVGPGAWQACERIATSGPNDVILPSTEVTGDVLRVRFQRGPEHRGCRFAAKAIPIVWLQPIEEALVVERGTSYVYEEGVSWEAIPWLDSALADRAHKLTVELPVGRDYELWVRLQDPGNPGNWLEQDPVVRTGGGGGNPH